MWAALLLICLLIVLLIILFTQSRYYRLASLLPAAKAKSVFGHALDICVQKDELLDKMIEIVTENRPTLEKHGILAVWLGPVVIVLLEDLQDIEQILTSRTLTKKALQYKFFEPWLGQGLFTSSGPHWHSHRKLITPAFHFSILEKFIPVFNANIDIYLRKLDNKVGKEAFNIENYVTYLSLDIIAETAMSAKINAQIEESEYAQKVKDLTETILLRCFRIYYYPDFLFNISKLGRRQKKNKEFVDQFINKLVNHKKRERDKIQAHTVSPDIEGKKTRVALMDLLLDNQSTSHLSDKDILDEVNTFMFGGHDTITSGINFTFYLLSKHPHIQEEVLKEIMDVVGEGKFTLNNLQNLKYLERVIKESLRFLPVAPFIVRAVEEDITLKSGHILPAGCSILLFIYKMHRNPNLFPDPEKFDPDRFLPDNCAKRHPYSYLPFSAGPRNCIGQKFAMLEMKAIIAATVRRFRLLSSGREMKPVAHIILRAADGIYLQLQHR